jgi:hypothetical protein
LFEEVIVGAFTVEFVFSAVQTGNKSKILNWTDKMIIKNMSIHLHDTSPNIDLPLHTDILKGLLSESVLAQRLVATRYGTGCGTRREDAIYAGLTHPVIAFRVDEESHVWVQISRGLADGTYFCRGAIHDVSQLNSRSRLQQRI